MADRELRNQLFDRIAVVGKAFASAKRLELIDIIAQGERSVEALAREAQLGLASTSAHLQILKMAHIVATRRDGTRIYYRLAGDDVASLYALLGQVARERSADVEQARLAYLGTGSVDDVDLIGRDELLRRMKKGEVDVIDVRPVEEYEAGHIPGARSLPFDEMLGRIDALPSDVEVIVYCRGAHCVMAHDAVRLLGSNGLHASRLEDGMLEWRLAGLPVEAAS